MSDLYKNRHFLSLPDTRFALVIPSPLLTILKSARFPFAPFDKFTRFLHLPSNFPFSYKSKPTPDTISNSATVTANSTRILGCPSFPCFRFILAGREKEIFQMENQQQFWQFSDQLRLQSSNFANLSINDSIWSNSVTKRPEERRNFDSRVGGKTNKQKGTDFNGFNDGWKNFGGGNQNQYKNVSGLMNEEVSKTTHKKKNSNNYNDNDGKNSNGKNSNSVDKRFKTLPPSEALPRNETVGGYIFVCNNDTMQENLRRQLFGLPPRYRDSVRAITPGLPLFLYNYSTHQLHGIFEASSFGGTNIDPTAWEDKKCTGESRFPAQVKVVTRKNCEPLEEDAFRPILHHYDGPKFRLELNIPEALALLDIFAESSP